MSLPGVVQDAVASYLAEIDTAIPQFVEGLYLTGSVALGDFQPSISDIDLVAVCARGPRISDLEALATVHRPSKPNVDVLYLTWDDLQSDPRDVSAAHSLEGTFHTDGAFAANPVEWRTLQTCSIALRGSEIAESDVWFDPAVLRRWNVGNLNDYWRGRLDWMRRLEPTEAVMRWEYGLQWLVLGVPRLHYTISTLDITSKTGGGRYALGLVDGLWRQVVETSMALRHDQDAPLPATPEELRGDAVELVTWLIDDANRLVGGG